MVFWSLYRPSSFSLNPFAKFSAFGLFRLLAEYLGVPGQRLVDADVIFLVHVVRTALLSKIGRVSVHGVALLLGEVVDDITYALAFAFIGIVGHADLNRHRGLVVDGNPEHEPGRGRFLDEDGNPLLGSLVVVGHFRILLVAFLAGCVTQQNYYTRFFP